MSGDEHTVPATGFFVAIGHKPNTDVFADFITLDDQGYIVNAEPGTSKTNVEVSSSAATPRTRCTAKRSPRQAQGAWPPSTPSATSPRKASTDATLARPSCPGMVRLDGLW